MKYEQIRDQIVSGHMLSWSHRPWKSWYDLQLQMVRMWTRSEHCHIGCAYRLEDRLFVIEAVRPLVRIFPLSLLRPFYWFPVPAHWNPEAERWFTDQVGKEYSRTQAVQAGINKLEAGKDDKWQCAELYQVGSKLFDIQIPGPATPSNLANEVMERYVPCHAIV